MAMLQGMCKEKDRPSNGYGDPWRHNRRVPPAQGAFCMYHRQPPSAAAITAPSRRADVSPQETNMKETRYLVIEEHTSEYPDPITFERGAALTVGEKYEGPEDWDDWIFCESPGQKGGWVPAQIIEIVNDRIARACEDYTARELNVRKGDVLLGARALNGWVWCRTPDSSESGWVPRRNLQEIRH
jgi:hypothetical protein